MQGAPRERLERRPVGRQSSIPLYKITHSILKALPQERLERRPRVVNPVFHYTNHASSLIYTATATPAKASRSRLVCEVANPEIPQKKRAVVFTTAHDILIPKVLQRE
jgi:hypothetical protein